VMALVPVDLKWALKEATALVFCFSNFIYGQQLLAETTLQSGLLAQLATLCEALCAEAMRSQLSPQQLSHMFVSFIERLIDAASIYMKIKELASSAIVPAARIIDQYVQHLVPLDPEFAISGHKEVLAHVLNVSNAMFKAMAETGPEECMQERAALVHISEALVGLATSAFCFAQCSISIELLHHMIDLFPKEAHLVTAIVELIVQLTVGVQSMKVEVVEHILKILQKITENWPDCCAVIIKNEGILSWILGHAGSTSRKIVQEAYFTLFSIADASKDCLP